MFRLGITVSEEVNQKLNDLSKKWGVSKSNLCAMVIGQYVDGIDRAGMILDKYAMEMVKRDPGEGKK